MIINFYFQSHCPQTVYEMGRMEFFFWEPIKRNDIVWNFEKFLVDRDGRPRYRFHPGNWEGGAVVEPYLQSLIAESNSSSSSSFSSSSSSSSFQDVNNGSQAFPMNFINVAMKKLDAIFSNSRQKQTGGPRGPTSNIPHPEPSPEFHNNPPPESGPSLRPEGGPNLRPEGGFSEPEPSRG